jgi:hypothetical protein
MEDAQNQFSKRFIKGRQSGEVPLTLDPPGQGRKAESLHSEKLKFVKLT